MERMRRGRGRKRRWEDFGGLRRRGRETEWKKEGRNGGKWKKEVEGFVEENGSIVDFAGDCGKSKEKQRRSMQCAQLREISEFDCVCGGEPERNVQSNGGRDAEYIG